MKLFYSFSSKNPGGSNDTNNGIPNIVVHVYDEAKKGKLLL